MTDARSGLYIHVPFCSGKCHYCDFYSINAPGLKTDYLAALAREAQHYQGRFPSFDTLYIGGGTPSLLSGEELDALFECVSGFDFSPDTEITVEVNPEDVTLEWARSLINRTVNRISVGAQSFSDADLRVLGRRHTAGQTAAAIKNLREAGFKNISLDLIYGLPAQDVAGWRKNLEWALQFEPEHLSCYQLTVEPGTALAGQVKKGGLRLPDEERGRELFLFTRLYLEDHGFDPYEVSNFSRGRERRSRHNGKYWRRSPYLGLGPAAHSFLKGVRWWNERSVRRYCERLENGDKAVADREVLTTEQVLLERIYLGLRTGDGVEAGDFMDREGARDLAQHWMESGWAVVRGDRIVLTPEGLVIVDCLIHDWNVLDA